MFNLFDLRNFLKVATAILILTLIGCVDSTTVENSQISKEKDAEAIAIQVADILEEREADRLEKAKRTDEAKRIVEVEIARQKAEDERRAKERAREAEELAAKKEAEELAAKKEAEELVAKKIEALGLDLDVLRPTNNTQAIVASGPRPLMFRGVQGAPGDGDQALGREVGKLLAQSGAQLTTTAQPGALILSAQVSKTPGANSDRLEIVWHVQDSNGENVGQVTQANDVPRGLLDNAWGEDAVYAAEGARDGIIELLQGVGALDS